MLPMGVAPESMFGSMKSSIDSISALFFLTISLLFFFQTFMVAMREVSKRYLGMARQHDTAELNLNANKGEHFLSTLLSFAFFVNFLLIHVSLFFLFLEHLCQVTSDRDSANARVTELEERVAALEKEAAAAKKKVVAAVERAKKLRRKNKLRLSRRRM